MQKKYVSVNAEVDTDGVIRPLLIRWHDDRQWEVTKVLHREPAKNYFPLPNGIYQLGLSAGAIVVYGYLLYIENRETYQCHANSATLYSKKSQDADR